MELSRNDSTTQMESILYFVAFRTSPRVGQHFKTNTSLPAGHVTENTAPNRNASEKINNGGEIFLIHHTYLWLKKKKE